MLSQAYHSNTYTHIAGKRPRLGNTKDVPCNIDRICFNQGGIDAKSSKPDPHKPW